MISHSLQRLQIADEFAQSITLTRPSDREVPQGEISIAVIWIKRKTFSSRSGVLRSGALDPEANFL
jgi:hypothetical protein